MRDPLAVLRRSFGLTVNVILYMINVKPSRCIREYL